jgi:hypothetical protein
VLKAASVSEEPERPAERGKEKRMGLLTKPNELTMKETYAGLIYGQPGVGKTTLALSSVNPVCIDVDRGMYRVEKRYQVPSLQVEAYQEVLDLLNSDELDGFNTIVIDTLGKLIDSMGEYLAKNNPKYRQSNGQLTMQGWGQVKIEFHALVKLINSKNKSVIFVAHESEEKEGDVTKKRPDVSGSARKDIVKELDFMGYMEMSGNKRTISFSPSSAYYAKNSLGLDSIIEIPGIQTTNSFIKDVIVSAIRSRKEQDKAQAGPYDETIKQIDALINAATSISDINEAYMQLATLDHIWDSKLYAWSKIREMAKTFNGTWDKAAKRFIGPAAPGPAAPTDRQDPTSSGNKGTAPPKTVEQKCHESMIEISNILDSTMGAGERVFTDLEVKKVKDKLGVFLKDPPETRLVLINKLLDELKVLLQRRISYLEDITAGAGDRTVPEQATSNPTLPVMYQEPESETVEPEDDGFEDDIPEDTTPGRGRGTSSRAPVAAESELDIF